MNRKDLYSKEVFTKDSLPHNRKEVFSDVLKLHYFSFIKMGLILFLFALPLLATSFVKDYSFIIAYESGSRNGNIVLICSAIEVIGLVLLAVPISGFGKIFREYAWLEPVFFLDDFKKGIKDNFRPTLISFLIIGVLNFVFYVTYYFSPNGWLIAIPFGFNVAVFYPILIHTIFINFTYTNPYFVNFKLGSFFYLKHLPTTLLSIILLVAIKIYDLFQLANIIAIMTKYIVIMIYLIFLLPIIILGIQLNELRFFDIHINSVRFPDLVDKGMEKDDDIKENNEQESSNLDDEK